jgi:hypothetical protein
MSEWSEIPLRVAAERKLAEEWALVLIAEGLSPSVRRAMFSTYRPRRPSGGWPFFRPTSGRTR